MSEEEKEAIYMLETFIINHKFYNIKQSDGLEDNIKITLNLIENQQKELNNLKEIEKSHQEENGKLRVELEQEKEKNNELEIELSTRDNINVDKLVEKYKYYRRLADSYQANCISKDKIKEKIKELDELIKEAKDELGTASKEFTIYVYQKNILKQLLEEK